MQLFAFLEERLGTERSLSILNYLQQHNCQLRISRPRKTKLGDFSYRNNSYKISVNSDLNRYRFILTLIHEVAHLKTHLEYGRRIRPHGNEWKSNYGNLLIHFNIKPIFDETEQLQNIFLKELNNPKACSGIDPYAEKVLSQFDPEVEGIRLDEIVENQQFTFKNNIYVKLGERRTRVLCLKLKNNRMYTIPKAALVEVV